MARDIGAFLVDMAIFTRRTWWAQVIVVAYVSLFCVVLTLAH